LVPGGLGVTDRTCPRTMTVVFQNFCGVVNKSTISCGACPAVAVSCKATTAAAANRATATKRCNTRLVFMGPPDS
jgi:hypothetical protein